MITSKASKLIGKTVHIKDSNTLYAGHWGVVVAFDGDNYHITGGSIGDSAPIFERDEFVIRRELHKEGK